jgi:hypothetical protein
MTTPDLNSDVRARTAEFLALAEKSGQLGAGSGVFTDRLAYWRAVVDAVTAVVAPQIARPLQARIVELEAAQSSAGQVERDRIVEAARNQRRLAWEQDCEPDVVRVWSAIAGWVRRGAVTEHDVRGAVRPEDEAAEADRLRARVELLTAALTELVNAWDDGAYHGDMQGARANAARALAAGETQSEAPKQ